MKQRKHAKGREAYPPTPELDKLRAAKPKADVIAPFIEWLEEQQIVLTKNHQHTDACLDEDGDPTCGMNELTLYTYQYGGIDKLLALYLDIDLRKVDKEKEAILEWHRRATGQEDSHA